jgi:hypothetical protein
MLVDACKQCGWNDWITYMCTFILHRSRTRAVWSVCYSLFLNTPSSPSLLFHPNSSLPIPLSSHLFSAVLGGLPHCGIDMRAETIILTHQLLSHHPLLLLSLNLSLSALQRPFCEIQTAGCQGVKGGFPISLNPNCCMNTETDWRRDVW